MWEICFILHPEQKRNLIFPEVTFQMFQFRVRLVRKSSYLPQKQLNLFEAAPLDEDKLDIHKGIPVSGGMVSLKTRKSNTA
jgi:hypothetical protein